MERSKIQESVFAPDSAALHLGYVIASLHGFSVDTALQLFEQRLRLFQVRRVKPFGEPAVDR